MGLTLPVTLLASICRTMGPMGVVGAAVVSAKAVDAMAAGAGVAARASPSACGMISIALICGFSTFGMKLTLILPSVTSTGTVSTYAFKGPPALTQTSKSLNSLPWTL